MYEWNFDISFLFVPHGNVLYLLLSYLSLGSHILMQNVDARNSQLLSQYATFIYYAL